MADQKVFSDGNVDIWVIRQNQLTNPAAPSITELNTLGINVSKAVAWDGTTWPNNTDSNMVDDRSIKDAGNAQTRGYAQYEATLNFFYPENLQDTTSTFGRVYNFLKDVSTARTPLYIVTRVLQTTTNQTDPLAVGDFVNVYKVNGDAFSVDTEGEDSYKYSVNFLPQGGVWVYTQAVTTPLTAITVTNPKGDAGTLTVGGHTALRATLNGKRVTNIVDWNSSDTTVATVSKNGVVTGVAAGTANITASHAAGTTSTATAVTVA